jgi:hypothetical protein
MLVRSVRQDQALAAWQTSQRVQWSFQLTLAVVFGRWQVSWSSWPIRARYGAGWPQQYRPRHCPKSRCASVFWFWPPKQRARRWPKRPRLPSPATIGGGSTWGKAQVAVGRGWLAWCLLFQRRHPASLKLKWLETNQFLDKKKYVCDCSQLLKSSECVPDRTKLIALASIW